MIETKKYFSNRNKTALVEVMRLSSCKDWLKYKSDCIRTVVKIGGKIIAFCIETSESN
jgi:hypothetical protein